MAGLVASVAFHVLLGLALAGLVWAVGAGWVRGRADALDGYAVGLLAVTAASFLLLVSPWLAPAALALVAPAARMRPRLPRDRSLLWLAPAALAVPFVLGLLLHAPTETLGSATNGETLWWANRIWSARESVLPFDDLLAEGQRIIYVEGAPSYVGAVLDRLPGFDAVLFTATSLPAFLFVSVVAALRLVLRGAPAAAPAWTALLGFVALASLTYPSFPTESGPVALALPLAAVAYRLAAERRSFASLALLTGVVGIDLLLTKVIALVPVGIVLGAALYERYWRGLSRAQRAAIAATLTALGGAVIAVALFLTAEWYRHLFDVHFLPATAAEGLGDQLTARNAAKLAPAFQVAGEILLLAALLRSRAITLAAALAVSVGLSWFLTGQGFYLAVGFALLFAAVFFRTHPSALRAGRAPLAAAAVSLALWGWFQDLTGVRVAALLVALSWTAFALGMGPRLPRRALPAAVAIACLALAAGGFRLEERYDDLTPADHDIWQRVHDVVPEDGLVFTSLTGRSVTLRTGWNNYPSVARRQLYLAGWYDGRLVSATGERDERLRRNRRVLTGAVPPDRIGLERAFGSYWAVLRRGEAAPPSFRRVYANERFALYRIQS